MDTYLIMVISIIVGALARTIYHFMFKIAKNPELAFDKKYLVTMLASILMTITAAPLLLLNVTVPQGSDAFVAISMFAIGFTANDLLNPPVSMTSNVIHDLRLVVAKLKAELEKVGPKTEG